MVTRQRLAALLCAAALVACEEARQPTALQPVFVGAPSFAAASGVSEGVTGNGQLTVGGELRTFAFSAVRQADGSASGGYELISRFAGVKIRADITCFSI